LDAPAPDLLEDRAPNQAHRAREDDRVAVGARRHGHVEEVAIAVEEAPQVAVVLPVAVVLWRLNERNLRVSEMADCVAQPVGLDHVVGVDNADPLDLAWQPPGRLVQRTRLEPGPPLEVYEVKAGAESLAESLERPPDDRV